MVYKKEFLIRRNTFFLSEQAQALAQMGNIYMMRVTFPLWEETSFRD